MLLALTLPNTRVGHLQPPEDAFLKTKNGAVVADGITRESVPVKDRRGLTFEQAAKGYPNPSGARLASDVFCEVFAKQAARKVATADRMRQVFVAGNKAVREINEKFVPKPDYLANDFYGCVAAGCVVENGKMIWGSIGDCGIVVYGKNGDRRFETNDQVLSVVKYFKRTGFDLRIPENRAISRRQFRNRPDNLVNGRPVSFGAITGEPEAEHYFEVGEFKLSKGDIVVVFSDGFWHTVRHRGFFRCVNQPTSSMAEQLFVPFALKLGRQNQSRYGLEGALVAFRYE